MNVVCDHCDSLSFLNEEFPCCYDGKIHIDPFPSPPELVQLFISESDCGRNFRSNIRRYNTSFAFFASLTVNLHHPPGHGSPLFRMSGQMYHNQLYIYQPDEANQHRLSNPVTARCRPDVMEIISRALENHNHYARAYRTMAEVEIRHRELALQQNRPVPTVSMYMLIGPDRRRYNQPLQEDEAADIFTSTDGAPDVPQDIVVYPHSNNDRLRLISYLSPNSDHIHYCIHLVSQVGL